MVQVLKLTRVGGDARTYSAEVVSARPRSGFAAQTTIGFGGIRGEIGERVLIAARGVFRIGDTFRVWNDDDVYRVEAIERLPPFGVEVEVTGRRIGGAVVIAPFRP